ncbi:MAG: dockerin type I domain-containing protein [Oscillospiraceae bacterium]|jgi:hypothetical protein|nr:dockerin type I domain-containing protein [Oscillospiraceae bacterium]
MNRSLSIALSLFFLVALCGAPVASAVDNPIFSVYIDGNVDQAVKWNGADTFIVDWKFQAFGSDLRLRGTQGIRLAYDKTVLQLIGWNSTAIDDNAWNTAFALCSGVASPDGVYPYNFAVYTAQNLAGDTGYLNLTLGHPTEAYESFYLIESLMKVRFAFRPGKSAADLRAGSLRCMTAVELNMTGQSSAVRLATNDGIIYHYLDQSGGVPTGNDLLNAPEFDYPGSEVTGQTLTVSPETWSPAAAGGSAGAAVTANVAWTAVSGAAWLSVSPSGGSGSGSLTLTAAANTGSTDRTGTVTVSGGGLSRTITVTQAAPAPAPGGATAGLTAPKTYAGAGALTYTVSLANVTDTNMITVNATFDAAKLTFAGSRAAIPGASILRESYDPVTGVYGATVALLGEGLLFRASAGTPILTLRFHVGAAAGDVAASLTAVSFYEVSSPIRAVRVVCTLNPAGVVSAFAPYDMDADGAVTLADLSLVIYNYYLVGEGHADWGAAQTYDANGDGIVDLLDIMIISSYL